MAGTGLQGQMIFTGVTRANLRLRLHTGHGQPDWRFKQLVPGVCMSRRAKPLSQDGQMGAFEIRIGILRTG
jgi:hypothetical protein